MMAFILSLMLALVVLNLWTFVLFAWDKMQAEQGGWRVSEASLLSLALIGGIGGAYAGRAVFRHKTRKKSFSNALQYIGFFQLVALTFCGVYFYEPGGLSTPVQAEEVQTFAQRPQSHAYYPNCSTARSAGVAPLYRGDPGYRSPLDRDNDGIACEPYRGR
ncbi:DUF1294 domain-containing protein [Sphingorhabdus sp. 109]|jgi:uncharacterized membrane protein YsdA (DUF1294 family)|uniref:DUF1294 domain-containing protein n=1 Tax=Sphingorhabdus sp. 109 TaxID=2653173 RepID=UPI001F1894AF|nr:DUF1294 domain-containing protein [Sphingorhabdus sp. 109]